VRGHPKFLIWLYQVFLRLYPVDFRAEFGDEMVSVLTQAFSEAVHRGRGAVWTVFQREMRDLPVSLWGQHWSRFRKEGRLLQMENFNSATGKTEGKIASVEEKPATWGETLLGMGPFLIAPAIFITGFLVTSLFGALKPPPEPILTIVSSILVLIYVGPFLFVLGLGWVKGFPRWSYPYWGIALLFSIWLMDAATPGLRFFGYSFEHDDLWGWRAWIPVALVAVVAFLLSRIRPLRLLAKRLWQDWTRLSFAIYGVLPLAVLLAFDEVHAEEAYVVALNLLLGLGALCYMRSIYTWQRILSLLAGLLVTWAAATVYLAIYWNGRQEPWMDNPGNWVDTALWMNKLGGFLVLILLVPACLRLLRLFVNKIRPLPSA